MRYFFHKFHTLQLLLPKFLSKYSESVDSGDF